MDEWIGMDEEIPQEESPGDWRRQGARLIISPTRLHHKSEKLSETKENG